MTGTNPVKKLGTLAAAWRLRSTIISMLKDTWKGDYKMTFFSKVSLIGALLYVISPVDFIPDIFPVVGWADDAGVVFLLLGRLVSEAGRYAKMRAARPFKLTRVA